MSAPLCLRGAAMMYSERRVRGLPYTNSRVKRAEYWLSPLHSERRLTPFDSPNAPALARPVSLAETHRS
eukprot:6227006-Prymnesium_polylepis.11